ncbi:hypothetical protein PG996_010431 [Apiospora saccharicola]|uniref:Uncharacterized protein n=1 Tax=Apiospora saccharicola TaxID=335842 RepID=A0ABR1UR07_9PEZI
MRVSLHTTALLLWPVLATASTAGNRDGPAAVIQLGLQEYYGNVLGDAHLQLDVLESAEPCGYGNITLNGDQLPQDEEGRGSGPIIVDNGRIIVGDWHFDCVESDRRAEQLLRFNVVNIDGKPVGNVGFSTLFHQQFPISVTYVDGAESVINTPTVEEDTDGRKLNDELVELARMKTQLLKLQEKIALKEKVLSDEFGYVREESEPERAGCESFKCVVSSLWKKAHGRLSTYFRNNPFQNEYDNGSVEDQAEKDPYPCLNDGSKYTCLKDGPIRVGDDNSFRKQQAQLFRQGSQRNRPEITISSEPEKERHLSTFEWSVIIAPTVVMILGLIFALLLYLFCTKTRAERSDRRNGRRRPNPNRRALAREHRVATKAAMRAKFGELMRRFQKTFARRSLEDEEKEAILRRLHARSNSGSNNNNNNNVHDHNNHTITSYSISDTEDDVSVSESDSDMSTTMEQDLASFRSVADTVGDMVMAAEEGRTRRAAAHHQHQHHYQQHQVQPQPPRFTPSPAYFASRSRRSTFSDGISIDEELPAYEERPSRVSLDSASHVPNGIRYTPGSTTYVPSENSPLDEVLGRKAER